MARGFNALFDSAVVSLQDNATEFQQVVNSIHRKEITTSIIGFPEMEELKAQVFSETGKEISTILHDYSLEPARVGNKLAGLIRIPIVDKQNRPPSSV